VSAVELGPTMDASIAAPARSTPGRGWTLGGAAVLVLGCVLLEARPALVGSSSHPGTLLVVLFVALLAVGASWPLPDDASRPRAGLARTTAVVLIGVAAFALGRVVGGGHAPVPATLAFVAANTLAAVAEEAFFRRLCFGLLAPAGTAWAVFGSALLFAVVHVTTYGWWVLPLDLAAGLVFGWQRATTGSWSAPAVTHVVVNLLVVL
jgi:membrane protease YdiL (CAAX protease family)